MSQMDSRASLLTQLFLAMSLLLLRNRMEFAHHHEGNHVPDAVVLLGVVLAFVVSRNSNVLRKFP